MERANEKLRLDILISQKYSFSREYSKAVIENGNVFVNGIKKMKPGEKTEPSAEITVTAGKMKYVGRGGYKLEKALDKFNIDLNDKICMDIGASTGGFTDCMLQNGAEKVYAVDVGSSQLADSLISDARVVSMENTNILTVDGSVISDNIDFIAVDVSFISLTKIMKTAAALLTENGEAVFLIKPQFESGKRFIGKRGIVKDAKTHGKVIRDIYICMKNHEINPLNLSYSPIKGQLGNIEYLIYGSRKQDSIEESCFNKLTSQIVSDAHRGELFEKNRINT